MQNNDNAPQNPNTQQEKSTASGHGLGARLKATREEKGLSLDTVADELRILKRHLEAIERNDYDNLPQAAFTRGFIGNYAKFLKLDVHSVLAEYDATLPDEKKNHDTSFSESASLKPMGKLSRNDSRTSKSSAGLLRLTMILGLLALAVFAFFYFTKQNNDALTSGNAEQTTSVLDDMMAQDSANQDGANQDDAGQVSANQDGGEQAAAGESANDAQAAQNAQTVVADPNAPNAELVFWVMNDTAIKITDQKGKVVMDGNYSRGEHRATGQPPFQLNIGNASRVRLNMNTIPQNKTIRANMQADGSASLVLAP